MPTTAEEIRAAVEQRFAQVPLQLTGGLGLIWLLTRKAKGRREPA